MAERTMLQQQPAAAADMAMLRQHGGSQVPQHRPRLPLDHSEQPGPIGSEAPRFQSEIFSRDSRESIETMSPPLVKRSEGRRQWRMAASSRAMSQTLGESPPEAGSVRRVSSTLTAEVLERVEREHPSLSAGWGPPAAAAAAAGFDVAPPERAGRWVAQSRSGSTHEQKSSWGSIAADKQAQIFNRWSQSPLSRSPAAAVSALLPNSPTPVRLSSGSWQLPRAPAGSAPDWAAGTPAGPAAERPAAGAAERREYDRHPWLLRYRDAVTERRFRQWQACSVMRAVRSSPYRHLHGTIPCWKASFLGRRNTILSGGSASELSAHPKIGVASSADLTTQLHLVTAAHILPAPFCPVY
jgi:hypothetical protein